MDSVRPSRCVEPPAGTVALVFTDVPSASRLWERCAVAMRKALELQEEVLRGLLERHGGYEVKTQGGSFMVAFASAGRAVRWCLEAQKALLEAPWPEELLAQPEAAEELGPRGLLHRGLRVRMGVHVGEPELRVEGRGGRVDYLGSAVNTAARVVAAGHGGQVLVSGEAWSRSSEEELGPHAVRPLGAFRLRGLGSPVSLVEVLPTALSERRFSMPLAPRERQGNVPAVQSDLIGRSSELETLRRWFREGSRLVTLLGPGGMGKTRLATYLGGLEQESCAWEGGVWLCELEQVRDTAALCLAVTQALGLSLAREEEAGDRVESLGLALNDFGEVLIILDNLEQATRAAMGALERWRVLAPRARFLVTTREKLGLTAERVMDLGPLPLPAAGETRLEVIARSEAVRLFVQRAREVRGHFELTVEEAPHVVEIVRRLDGIALAIELAAARTGVLGVGQLRERLSRRFELLRSGRRDASGRQATLRGAIDWSWNLLDAAERAVLAQCSVFRGGFTLEAAEAVLELPPGSASVREVLQSLRARSLVRDQEVDGPGGEGRLMMYESIRQYAAERLQALGGEAALVARHAEWHVALAGRLRGQVRGAGGAEALRRLVLEQENLLAACDAVEAVRGGHEAAQARFAEQEEEPESLADPVLRGLVMRLRAASGQEPKARGAFSAEAAGEVLEPDARQGTRAASGGPAPSV
nr:adenylate/guanylate cyclase domain-containing protein [Hyalangium versicolor]